MGVFDIKRGKREIEDVETGERVFAVVQVRRDFIQEEYFCMFQAAAKEIAKDKDLVGEDLRVLHILYGYLDTKNFISLSQSEICSELSMDKSNVNKAIGKLISKGIIIKGPKVGKSWTYIFNANYGYKGKLKFLKQERRKHLQLIEENETEKEINKVEKDKKNKSETKKIIEKGEKTLF